MMMIPPTSLFLVIACLTSIVAGNSAKVPSSKAFIFQPIKKVRSNANKPKATIQKMTALSIPRGGGDQQVVAGKKILDIACKFGTVATATVAAITYLAPSFATEHLYGLPPDSCDLVVWLIRAMGGALSMISIQAACLFFWDDDMPITKAIGYGCLPFMINEIRTLILNETRKWDMPPWGLLFVSLPISSFCAYSLILSSESSNSEMVVAKFFCYWVLITNGIALGLFPKKAGEGWGIDMTTKGATESLRLHGVTCMSAGLFMVQLLNLGMERTTAFVVSFLFLVVVIGINVLPRLQQQQQQ